MTDKGADSRPVSRTGKDRNSGARSGQDAYDPGVEVDQALVRPRRAAVRYSVRIVAGGAGSIDIVGSVACICYGLQVAAVATPGDQVISVNRVLFECIVGLDALFIMTVVAERKITGAVRM